MENAGLSRCPSAPLRENQGHETDRFAAAQPRVSFFLPTSRGGFHGSFFGLVIAVIVGVLIGKDAASRGMSGVGWGLFPALICIIAVPIYLVVRKPRLDEQK
jgi:hypothetical protein